MKKPVTYLGDIFFYVLVLLSLICFIWILISPAKYFIIKELERPFQNKGESRAIEKFDQILKSHNISRDKYKPSIIIRKKSKELSIYANSIEIASYPIGIGRNVTGRKLNKYDSKTPEGSYFICNKILNHKFHMFLQINYPSSEDASRATINHIITSEQEQLIDKAEEEGNPPPSNTNLGGDLGIHGFGSKDDWTKDGSISMNNVDIEEVYWNIPIGCPIMILP